VRYDGTWRDRDPSEAPPGVPPAIRLKAPQQGSTTIRDRVQGEVTIANSELDDLIILRADGTPTYNLSVVVDDHDMAITHVIRGDDHLNNAFRQKQIYDALDWPVPEFAHVPLIHGPDGAKLSKRHGALGIDAYREMGYLPETLRNYLLRLGWSHGDDEIISTEEAVAWFDLDAVGRAPARFDFAKLDNLNGHYIRAADDRRLAALLGERLEKTLGHPFSETEHGRLLEAMPELKLRPKTLVELAANARFLVAARPLQPDDKAARLLTPEARCILAELLEPLKDVEWRSETLEEKIRSFADERGVKLGSIAQPLRAALTGSAASPGIFMVMEVLGRQETLERIADAAGLGSAS
jgi:glutamyl-tRNA synthetase